MNRAILDKLTEAKRRSKKRKLELDRINKAIMNFKSVKRLENGTMIESTDWKPGDPAFLVAGDDIKNGNRIALPVGKYTMADGAILIIREEAIIYSYKKTKK